MKNDWYRYTVFDFWGGNSQVVSWHNRRAHMDRNDWRRLLTTHLATGVCSRTQFDTYIFDPWRNEIETDCLWKCVYVWRGRGGFWSLLLESHLGCWFQQGGVRVCGWLPVRPQCRACCVYRRTLELLGLRHTFVTKAL